MGINLEDPAVAVRESRLGSVTGYCGSARELCRKSRGCTLCDQSRAFTQCISCSANQVMNQLVFIQDAAVVEHGPAGCSGDIPGRNITGRSGRKKRGLPVRNLRYINTNLEERDIIYGGADKLRTAVRAAEQRFRPRAVFVTTTCASAIIGDDVAGICDEMEKEIGIPVVPIFCEGFRSKVWATGFDAAYHGILRKIVKPPKRRQPDMVNVINFQGRDVFSRPFGQLGLWPNYIVPYTTVERLSHISEAAASVQICSTLGTYLAAGLEEYYGVPEVKAPLPFGVAGTDAFLRELGRVTHRESEAEDYIRSEKERIAPELDRLRGRLRGKRAFIGAGAAHAHGMAAVVRELSMELVGNCVWHHDAVFDSGDARSDTLAHDVETYGDFGIDVCNKQSYELVNMLNRARPDIYIARHAGTVWATKLGIPSFLMADEHFGIGYEGLLRMGRLILDTVSHPQFVRNIAAHSRLPYTKWWLEQKPTYFLGGGAE